MLTEVEYDGVHEAPANACSSVKLLPKHPTPRSTVLADTWGLLVFGDANKPRQAARASWGAVLFELRHALAASPQMRADLRQMLDAIESNVNNEPVVTP